MTYKWFFILGSLLHTVYLKDLNISSAISSLISPTLTSAPAVQNRSLQAHIKGDIMIGGLFPVHNKGPHGTACGEIQEDRGIQRLEAMLFTLDEINKNNTILPNITLGANIMDTCSRDTYALEQSLEYVRAKLSSLGDSEFVCQDGSNAKPKTKPTAVVGVIGEAYSSVSIQVANLLRLFQIPQLSYASTSAALSDKSRFDYFARTVPPDTFQAKAMVDIVQYFNWTYVSTVASEGDYGELGIEEFFKEARTRNVCIAISKKIPYAATDKTFDDVIIDLLSKPNAPVVVLFLRVEDATHLLSSARRHNVTNHFVWLASDGWGKQEMPVKTNYEVAEGAITIELQAMRLPDFDLYFKNLNPMNNHRNPWFKEYWSKLHCCVFEEDQTANKSQKLCDGKERQKNFKQESKIQFVYDAVYAMARAIHEMLEDACDDKDDEEDKIKCMKEYSIEGSRLYQQYLLNVSFSDKYGALVEFDNRGDGLGRYNIMNYRRNRMTRRYEYVTVGDWVSELDMQDHVMFAGGTLDIPSSVCSRPCGQAQVKTVQEGVTCCWICTPCKPYEFVKDEYTCEDCGLGWWPHMDMKKCFSLQEQYMQWDTLYAVVPMALSGLGILLTLIVMLTFVRFNETPLVKASGRELSFMLLSGFLICYLMTFILLARPSPWICAIQRFGIGFGFAVTYASLLTKTNRISRIFDSASRSAKRPPFISPRSQVVIAIILILIQVISNVVWQVLEPPGTRFYYPTRAQKILKCKIGDKSFLLSLVYNMLLIVICTVYAVKTRKIPENFNESKFIGFTMYTTCIIWLAFVPIYFGTLNNFEIQITTLCVSITLSASVALLCLFAPKMHIIIFQPEKNVRKLTMNSAQYKKGAGSSLSGAPVSSMSEVVKLNVPNSHCNRGGDTTETDNDRDSLDCDMYADFND